MGVINEALLDSKLAELESRRAWSPRVMSMLESFVRSDDDFDLFRVDPLQYAKERGLEEAEAVDLFLHGANVGLFDFEWNIICGCCGLVYKSLRNIGGVQTHFVCDVCRMENDLALDELIQVSFTLAPSIRDNKFLSPDELTADDYVFRYRQAKGIVRLPAANSDDPVAKLNIDYIRGMTNVNEYVEPGEKLMTSIDATPGLVLMGDLLHGPNVSFWATASDDEAHTIPMHVTFTGNDVVIANMETPETTIPIDTASGPTTHYFEHFASLSVGKLECTFHNNTHERICVWVADANINVTQTILEIPRFLSGKNLLTSQTFRDLYRSQVIEASEGLSIRDITFLFTDLKGSTALYDQLGDLKAYQLVHQHFDALHDVIVRNNGAVVKTIGDAVMASFSTPSDGVAAAMDILNAISSFNDKRTNQLILKIGLHTGHSIAVTLNDRLDYFGQTVNIAARVQQLAEADQIVISKEVYTAQGVQELLAGSNVIQQKAQVKGVADALDVYVVE